MAESGLLLDFEIFEGLVGFVVPVCFTDRSFGPCIYVVSIWPLSLYKL